MFPRQGVLEKISTGVLVLFFVSLKFEKLLFFGLLKMMVIFRELKNKHFLGGCIIFRIYA